MPTSSGVLTAGRVQQMGRVGRGKVISAVEAEDRLTANVSI
ncbi:hypothetical protein [Streptomyces albiflavescens]|nr:hypothetical protein [Streptomyces albiflavescens]